MKTLIYQHDGKVHQMCALDASAARLAPAGAELIEVEAGTSPCAQDPQSVFFDAWTLIAGRVVLDLPKAANIRLEQIRQVRDNRLKALDTEQIIALGKGDATAVAAVEARKQVLRDIPQRLDFSKAKNAYDLQHIVPPALV